MASLYSSSEKGVNVVEVFRFGDVEDMVMVQKMV
jgi:hypothetical protein